MEEAGPLNHTVEVVDPEVRAHVYSLVTALGGFNGDDADKYVLGDDALSCLRDIKRWLKLYDEKFNRMDVARCLGEANLVNGDLIQILSLWWNEGQQSKYMSRIALACVELLVPLTWPLEIHGEMTVNHHRHIPYLQQAQVGYKRGILNIANCGLLRAVIRIGLPSMAVPRSERTARDEGILKIMLYLLRNIAVITANARLAAEGEEEETSRSATINAFHDQDVFALILTMCSNVSDDFNMLDIPLLETLFHIVKGIDVEKLFMNDAQRTAKRTDELNDLLQQENSMRREYAKNAPTRHGRFGTMIWVKRDDAKMSTVSGQDVLRDGQMTLHKMDQSKKWNKPRRGRKAQDMSANNDFNTPVLISPSATAKLRTFVEEFLDSGFNPVFVHVRKAIERESVRVLDINKRHFLYTVSWFLAAERARRARQREKFAQNEKKPGKELEPDSFGLVAGVFNQETFVFLNRSMQNSLDNKEWEDLNAAMRCFTQILLTVQEMSQSPLEEDQEIAENIQNRIFYEETTHDRILTIIRGYTDQGFGYLDACTELSHVFLRMLERYSKENVDMQVRSRRRARKKKRDEQSSNEGNDEEQASDDEDYAEAEKMSKERKFDFTRFAAKFSNQKCVDTFVAFIKFYKELNTEQLKRAHRYFYRISFKQEMTVLLFRVDILNLFYRMIKGPGGMDSSKPIFKEWEELVRQLIRRLLKKLDQRPALVTELLFSKINSTAFYLEYGYEKQTITPSKRAPAELEVDPKAAPTPEEKLGIVVAALVKDEQSSLVKWTSEILGSAADEREAWELNAQDVDLAGPRDSHSPIISVKSQDESFKRAMFLNAKLRLLMTLVKFERLGLENVEGTTWVIPSQLKSAELRESKAVIDKALVIGNTDERDPNDLLRKKYGHEPRGGISDQTYDINFGSDSEGEDIVPDGPLFPANPRAKANALNDPKKKRKKREEKGEQETLDEETLEERRQARLENTRSRLAKIKSDLYVHASDEESDDEADQEFFRLEEERRKEQSERIKQALMLGRTEASGKKSTKKQAKRANESITAGEKEVGRKRRRRSHEASAELEDEDISMGDTDMQSPASSAESSNDADGMDTAPAAAAEDELYFDDNLAFGRNREREDDDANADNDIVGGSSPKRNEGVNEEDEEDAPLTAPSRRRMRAGFVVESDSE
ncbi:putative DNA repair protein (Tof1) [Aspergillus mulundensis]|uniref:Topoisomerase 1-associated factor 1 n=1 Tax=Aspergillus mulundensis TaxID=1810919 RepID=A0A3D8QZW8_9EURO|nr:Topoisomerase 1-associated factor 1 [Aspergillus mulundensis]RDW67124.1 Topoisomerase 1-associated factor 1 [Aspergillus mulundensis]